MNNLHAAALEVCRRRGITPTDPPPFDPHAYRIQQAGEALDAVIPSRFRHATADHVHVAAWVRAYLAGPTGAGNLLLLGPTGAGKTWQAYGALRRIVTTRANTGTPLNWRAVDHPTLNAELRPHPDDQHIAAQERYETCDLLLLDDLGAGRLTDWTADTLYRIVDTRWAHQRPTIAATNLDPDDLRDAISDRIVSRLADGVVVRFKGGDLRAAGGQP